jgi:hypothetical protein
MATQVKPSRVRTMIAVPTPITLRINSASPPRLISSLEAERDLFVRNNRRANEEVQFRKFFVHIGVASFE